MQLHAQTFSGKVFDADTREALAGATISQENGKVTTTGPDGTFSLPARNIKISISHSGYITKAVQFSAQQTDIPLERIHINLQEIVLTANRDEVNRTQAPVAIAAIGPKLIRETRVTTIDQLVNKVSGVYMVNLGNEQHSMGIRQPIGTRSLFLYLEDGIPVRTTGVFNHNTLMEMNMDAVRSIEVIKGPSSSLYGGEAIGGAINMITQAPTAIPTLKINLQGNDIGYRRIGLQTGSTKGKWGFGLSGYYASRNNGFIEFSDFHKGIFTARADYRFSEKTKLENSITYMDYYSDMSGSVDSTMFANKSFTSQQTFTYRKAKNLRHRSSLIHEWNDRAKTSINAIFRHNSLGQNPAYRIRDDYRFSGGTPTGKKDLAHGEINDNSFSSYVFIGQHRQRFTWLNAMLIGGLTLDLSPNTSVANYIKIKKDTITKKYTEFVNRKDSLLVDYKTNIKNAAAFINVEFNPFSKMHVVTSLRYDAFRYGFNNYLPASSVSGSADTIGNFSRLSPKIGFTYNFNTRRGIYANYSQGFVPPQVSELYRGVKVPDLSPAVYVNYEIGGWMEIIREKISTDISIYLLEGKNAIISVKYDDGTFGNANAGKTRHQGIEGGLNITPAKALQFRFSGAYSKHIFVDYLERGVKFNNNEINGAPRWTHNTEVTYRPSWIKGLRAGIEWQKMSSYFMDQANLFTYKGFDVVNVRLGYSFSGAEVWLNIINATDTYYAVNSSRSNSGSSYTPGEPRNMNLGISYEFSSLKKRK